MKLSIIFFYVCGFFTTVFCQETSFESLLDSAKYYLVNQQYGKAEHSLNNILRLQPSNSDAIYLLLATIQTKILDYESYNIDADYFIQKANSALLYLSKALPEKKGQDSLVCLFYIGNILGGISVIQAKVGNWPSAVQSGVNSLGAFKLVIKKNPDFFPAYLGLGIFNYYISQNLKWLPFFGDRRMAGLEQVRLSTKADIPYSYVAKNSLCWILLERNEYHAADSVASSVLYELPSNTIFIRLKARITFWKREWAEAIHWGKSLVALSEKRVPVNWADLFSGYQILVSSYDSLGDKKECLRWCKKALSRIVPEPYAQIPYVKKHLKFICEIQRKYSK
jgi:tetratricopeptide (TPR) repeat protein